MTNNFLLRKLDCKSNQFKVFDISNSKLLVSLNCCLNELTSLDLSNHTYLTEVDCSDNQITCIEVNESQLTNDASSWTKDDSSEWSLECD